MQTLRSAFASIIPEAGVQWELRDMAGEISALLDSYGPAPAILVPTFVAYPGVGLSYRCRSRFNHPQVRVDRLALIYAPRPNRRSDQDDNSGDSQRRE
jgi:hypothetical protein